MSKRKINQQQQRRITANRDKLLDASEHAGLVIADHGYNLEIEDTHSKLIACSKRQNLGPIVPGDKVIWQPATTTSNEQNGVILRVLERKTLLSRPDARGKLHAVAANIDQILVVVAPSPAPNLTTIDRYLVAAELQGISPVLLLNKDDLLTDDLEQKKLLEHFNYYENIGITTIKLSAKQKHNIELLAQQLSNKISVFVGQSGVGKSSLIANFVPDQEVKVGDISMQIQQGRHTTTSARLYHLANHDGAIIDSPGIREFPLWPLTPAELAIGFIEFKPFLHECKFRNCIHMEEPGCGLLHAANTGKISPLRLVSYQKILASMRG